MDLRSGQSVWLAYPAPQLHAPTAPPEIDCEVLIVGGGITGALIGYYLVREGVRTVLIDKERPGFGSTAASTGLLQYEIDTPLVDLIEQVGPDRAVHAYRRGLTAIDELERLVGEAQAACDFDRRDSLYFASSAWHLRHLKQEFAARREHGFDVSFLTRDEVADVSSIAASGAITSRGDAMINPFAFTHGLLRAAQAAGLTIYRGVEMRSCRELPAGVITDAGETQIRSAAVVLATGYAAHEQLASFPGNLQSTYALASQAGGNFPGWPAGQLIWETARPYFYARQTADGRAIIGGGDTAFAEDHTRDALVERKTEDLLRRFHELFPDASIAPEFTWAGTFAETKDGLAYIGRVPNTEHTYAALGYGGNGITFSTIAARLICDLYLRRPNPDAAVFGFKR